MFAATDKAPGVRLVSRFTETPTAHTVTPRE